MKTKIALIVLVMTAGIVCGVFILACHPQKKVAVSAEPKPVVQAVPAVEPPAAPEITSTDEPVVVAEHTVKPAKHKAKKAKKSAQPKATTAQDGQSLVINGYAVQDPDARLALSGVGADPEAEAYWSQAINNPNLPAEERKDLIEDLNEDGLSDPKHPSDADKVIIANRIQLIEEMTPSAMDPVNVTAFGEAEGDLLNLLNGLPVK